MNKGIAAKIQKIYDAELEYENQIDQGYDDWENDYFFENIYQEMKRTFKISLDEAERLFNEWAAS